MSTPSIPTVMATHVHDHVLSYGRLDVETGLFLVAPRGSEHVTLVAFAGTRGVIRHPGQFAVTGRAMSQLLRHLAERDLVVCAQVHSHRGPAGLSKTDLAHGFSVDGFITAVIPHYGRPPLDPRQWGWWRYKHGRWSVTPPFRLADEEIAATSTIVFDEDGVDET